MKSIKTRVDVEARDYWNGSFTMEKVVDKTVENYGKDIIEDISTTNSIQTKKGSEFIEGKNVIDGFRVNAENISITFKSKKEAKEFVKTCVRPCPKDTQIYYTLMIMAIE